MLVWDSRAKLERQGASGTTGFLEGIGEGEVG